MNGPVRVSVVIPTHNRGRSLPRSLDALRNQTCPPGTFEVIVVADGCTDDTAQIVQAYPAPFRLVFLDQPAQGPAAARNLGAQSASGDLLLFLDDDIEAWPGLVAAHLAAAGTTGPRAVIGYLPPVLEHQKGYFRAELRGWWEDMFSAMREPGYRFRYSNLLTGNFSVPAELFRRLGGFNTALRCHEDYEFGYRLIRAGVELVYEPRAGGYHHENTLFTRSLARKFEEGQADVFLARLYPELLPGLQLFTLSGYGRPLWRLLFQLAFNAPGLGDWLAGSLRHLLPVFELLSLRGRWRRTVDQLLVYHYLRGVSAVVGDTTGWKVFLEETRALMPDEPAPLALDLAAGMEAARKQLDERSPEAVCVCYGEQEIGLIPRIPGAEPLRGRHLGRILQAELGWWTMGVAFPAQAAGDESEHARLMVDLFARWRTGAS